MKSIGLNFIKFEIKYRILVNLAVLRMEEVLDSPIFITMLYDEISKSNFLEGELSGLDQDSPEEIYNRLFPITLYLNTYYTSMSVIGHGVAGDKNIYLNTKYLSDYKLTNLLDLMKIGSNLLHEHSHDCGFKHDFRNTKRRKNSVSYILNRTYERTFRKLYGLLEPVVVPHIPWYRRWV